MPELNVAGQRMPTPEEVRNAPETRKLMLELLGRPEIAAARVRGEVKQLQAGVSALFDALTACGIHAAKMERYRNELLGTLNRVGLIGQPSAESEALRALDALATPLPGGDMVLEKHAQVGNTIFHPGIKWSSVIGRAEREYEYQHDQDPERYKKIGDLRALLAAPTAQQQPVASGNPLLWNVHCMFQEAERGPEWEAQWRDLLAAIEQHLQRARYPNAAPLAATQQGEGKIRNLGGD